MSVLVSDLPVPRAVVLDLEKQAASCLRIFQIRHRKVFLARPVSGIGHPDHGGRPLFLNRLHQLHAKLRQRIALPVHLSLPAVMRNIDLHLFISRKHALFLDALIIKRRKIFQRLRFMSLIPHRLPHADDRISIIKLQIRVHKNIRHVIAQDKFEQSALFVPLIRMPRIFHPAARRCHDIFIAVPLIRPVKSRKIHLHKAESVLCRCRHDILAVKRQCGKMEQL